MAGKKTIKSAIESMMFVWGEPLDIKEAAEVFNMDKKEIYPYFKELQEEYEQEGTDLAYPSIWHRSGGWFSANGESSCDIQRNLRNGLQ